MAPITASPLGGTRTSGLAPQRSLVHDQVGVVALLTGAVVVGVLAMTAVDLLPYAALGVVLVLGAMVLGLSGTTLVSFAVIAVFTAFVVRGLPAHAVGGPLVLVVAGVVAGVLHSSRRPQVEAAAARDVALAEVRAHVAERGDLRLPVGWGGEVELQDPDGAAFSHDFLLVAPGAGNSRIESVLVAVAGDGSAGAGQALLLAGAFNALLGTVDHRLFLAAANTHLIRQGQTDGVAAAAHLVLDPEDGRYRLSTAGQAPHAQFHAGSGRWQVGTVASGALLGMPHPVFPVHEGQLLPGDALLLYTGRGAQQSATAPELITDRLLGAAEQLVPKGFRGGARTLTERLGHAGEDRALILIWRE